MPDILIVKDGNTLVPKLGVTDAQRLDWMRTFAIYDINTDGSRSGPYGPTSAQTKSVNTYAPLDTNGRPTGQIVTPDGDVVGGGSLVVTGATPQATFRRILSDFPVGVASWAWPWVVDTAKVPSITNPLARYHIYFATDHNSRGGIYMMYTNNLQHGPYTLYRGGPDATNTAILYEDLDDTAARPPANSTETPSLVYDPIEGKLRMFYHCVNPCYGSGTGNLTNVTDPSGAKSGCTAFSAAQGTMSALQYDARGTVFTKDRGFALDVYWSSGGHGYGDHTGYFLPFYARGGWHAYHLGGGTDSGSMCVSHAIGNDLGRWRSEKRQLSHYTNLFKEQGFDNYCVLWHNSTVVDTNKGPMLIGAASTPASGLQQGQKLLFSAPVDDDMATITGPATVLYQAPPAFPIRWMVQGSTLTAVYCSTDTTEMGVCNVQF